MHTPVLSLNGNSVHGGIAVIRLGLVARAVEMSILYQCSQLLVPLIDTNQFDHRVNKVAFITIGVPDGPCFADEPVMSHQ